ncbi:hypothetical protein FA95DRAFT_1564414 [Auriscalpium vulgare]|uniref:Uncharacterized protein n=1 Tax=Auriscalpium vulgare TaxID=40419 RepID=A0ACB8RE39_9AGAM|nr:hypothetical protein FA95DRAFT_1564414 [Auriscalpium vulgare]
MSSAAGTPLSTHLFFVIHSMHTHYRQEVLGWVRSSVDDSGSHVGSVTSGASSAHRELSGTEARLVCCAELSEKLNASAPRCRRRPLKTLLCAWAFGTNNAGVGCLNALACSCSRRLCMWLDETPRSAAGSLW